MQLFFLDSHATCCAQCRKDGRCDGCNHLDDELDALFLCHNAEKFLMVNTFVLIVQSAVSQCSVRSECVQSNLQFDCP